MLFAGAKHEVVVNYKVSFDNDGKVVTATFKAFANAGCSHDGSIIWTQVICRLILYQSLNFDRKDCNK